MNPMPNDSPPQLPSTVPASSLPQMNATAAQSTQGTSKGVAKCKKQQDWFGLLLLLVDDNGKTTALADVTVSLKIPDLGAIDKFTPMGSKPILVPQLEPGGKGDVVQMKHDTNVYEASGDFS